MSLARASALAVLPLALALACGPKPRAATSFKLVTEKAAPSDASVTIDEEYIGPLGWVAARGVRLPVGEHRITIEREGYFPFDALVVAGREPLQLRVKLVRIPD